MTSTPSSREKLEAWLRYYDDLNLGQFYRGRKGLEPPLSVAASEGALATIDAGAEAEVSAATPTLEPPSLPAAPDASLVALRAAPPIPHPVPSVAKVGAPAWAGVAAPKPVPASIVLPVMGETSLFEAVDRVEGDTLERIREDLGDCTRCRLHKQRNSIVFGVGNPRAELVFVGEGPGHDEDVQGVPFVGRAGKLLTQMIEAMGLTRDEVYICNVVKCRPPENRKPEDDEIATCSPYLYRQLDVIGPKAVVCLGATAAQALLKTKDSISRYRGQWFDFRGAKLLATYHPAYLLRNPNAKGEVWKDLQKVMALLGLKAKRASR